MNEFYRKLNASCGILDCPEIFCGALGYLGYLGVS